MVVGVLFLCLMEVLELETVVSVCVCAVGNDHCNLRQCLDALLTGPAHSGCGQVCSTQEEVQSRWEGNMLSGCLTGCIALVVPLHGPLHSFHHLHAPVMWC